MSVLKTEVSTDTVGSNPTLSFFKNNLLMCEKRTDDKLKSYLAIPLWYLFSKVGNAIVYLKTPVTLNKHKKLVVQRLERAAHNGKVAGSNPARLNSIHLFTW